MRNISITFLLSLLCIATLSCDVRDGETRVGSASQAGEYAQRPDVQVMQVRGYVRVLREGSDIWRRLEAGDSVSTASRIAVGIDGSVVCTISQGEVRLQTPGIYQPATGELVYHEANKNDPPAIKPLPIGKKPDPPPVPLHPEGMTVTAIKGRVQWRSSEHAEWRDAKVGDQLSLTYQVRTGLRSFIELRTATNKKLVIDRISIVKLTEDVLNGDTGVKTDIGMKYGRTTYKVKAADARPPMKVLRDADRDCAEDWGRGTATLIIR